MARKKPGQQLAVDRLVQRNLARRINTFKPVYVECPNEIEVENEDGTKTKQVCRGVFWDKRTLHQIFYVPQKECQRPGGMNSAQPHDHFICVNCGNVLTPKEWKQLAKEAYEAGEKQIIIPGDTPDDNGDKPDA